MSKCIANLNIDKCEPNALCKNCAYFKIIKPNCDNNNKCELHNMCKKCHYEQRNITTLFRISGGGEYKCTDNNTSCSPKYLCSRCFMYYNNLGYYRRKSICDTCVKFNNLKKHNNLCLCVKCCCSEHFIL